MPSVAFGANLFWSREQRLPPPEGIDAFLKDGARIRDLLEWVGRNNRFCFPGWVMAAD